MHGGHWAYRSNELSFISMLLMEISKTLSFIELSLLHHDPSQTKLASLEWFQVNFNLLCTLLNYGLNQWQIYSQEIKKSFFSPTL